MVLMSFVCGRSTAGLCGEWLPLYSADGFEPSHHLARRTFDDFCRCGSRHHPRHAKPWQSLWSCARQTSSRCSTPATTAPKYASGLAYRKATSRSRARTRSVSFLVSVASVRGRPPTLGRPGTPAGDAGVERPATSAGGLGKLALPGNSLQRVLACSEPAAAKCSIRGWPGVKDAQ